MTHDSISIAGCVIVSALFMVLGVWGFTREGGILAQFTITLGAFTASHLFLSWFFAGAVFIPEPQNHKDQATERLATSGGLEGSKPFWPVIPLWSVLLPWIAVSSLFLTPTDRASFLMAVFNVCLFVVASYVTACLPGPRAYEIARKRYDARTNWRKELRAEWVLYEEGRSLYAPYIHHELEEIQKAGGPEPSDQEATLKNELVEFTRFMVSGTPIRFLRWREQLGLLDKKAAPAKKPEKSEEVLSPEGRKLRDAKQRRKDRALRAKIQKADIKQDRKIQSDLAIHLARLDAGEPELEAKVYDHCKKNNIPEEDWREFYLRVRDEAKQIRKTMKE